MEHSQPSVLGTCFNVLAQETLGALATWSPERKRLVATRLQGCQDPATGLFLPRDFRIADLRNPRTCDATYIRNQVTYFCLSALRALDAKPLHPLSFATRFLDASYTIGWMDGGPWLDPWNHSNRIMFALRFLLHLAQDEGHEQALMVFDRVLDYLDERQSPGTGLWHGPHDCDTRTAVYAAYHFFPFYFWRRRAVRHPESIVDATLSIREANGLFGGGACEDLDAVDVLVSFSRITSHRAADVRQSLQSCFTALLGLQDACGGFPNYLPTSAPKSLKRRLGEWLLLDRIAPKRWGMPPQRVYYSGWRRMGGIKGEPDAWGTWFRTLAIAEIVARYPELSATPFSGRFHELPCLGWHDPPAIAACAKTPL